VSQQGHLGAGRTTPVITHCCESLMALPELLTQHLEKVITLRVAFRDQGNGRGFQAVLGIFSMTHIPVHPKAIASPPSL